MLERSRNKMIVFGILVAGFAGGWVFRSSVDSTRGIAVAGVSAFYGAMERGRRLLAVEREHLEDLVAEGRSKYEMARLRAVRSSTRDVTGTADRSVADQEAQFRSQPDAPKRDRAA
jgi:hypothetical protein